MPALPAAEARLRARVLDAEPLAARCTGRCGPEAAERARARRDDVYLDNRIAAIFAIADAHDARGEIDTAFAAYEAAHRLALERDALEKRSYDRAQDVARIQSIVELSERLPEIASPANAPRPIFIVGMPRSGTTLIEAVLGAHSRVFACGERPAMRRILRWPMRSRTDASRRRTSARCRTGRSSISATCRNLRGADHITDKHPRNFEAAGLIARMLPNAVIVHVRRNPVETCLSIYRQEFNKHWTFAHRLADIADYYARYAQLVAHWERVLPGRFVTIQYEDFVADFANAAPQLVQACGWSWEPQCLEFQKSPRAIVTFSTVQARSEVALGNGRAQQYEKHLRPLVAALEAAGIDLQTGATETPRVASFSLVRTRSWRAQNVGRRWIAKGVVMEEPKRLSASVTAWLALFLAVADAGRAVR